MSTVLVLYSTLFVNWINTAKRGNQKTPLDLFLFFLLYSFHHFICCCIGCYVFHLNFDRVRPRLLRVVMVFVLAILFHIILLYFSIGFYLHNFYLYNVHCAYSNRDQQQFTPVPQHTFWPMCSLITPLVSFVFRF